jgi:hypothetical protein
MMSGRPDADMSSGVEPNRMRVFAGIRRGFDITRD